jgi:hypothetical protein
MPLLNPAGQIMTSKIIHLLLPAFFLSFDIGTIGRLELYMTTLNDERKVTLSISQSCPSFTSDD